MLSANITIYNVVTGIISEPQKLPDIVKFMLFTSALEPDLHHYFDIVEFTFFTSGSALEPEPSSLFWLILPSMLHQTGQLHYQLI